MLPITFFRSSLINNLSFCEHQSFLTYCLGLYNRTNVKAEIGTTTHKILESLAIAKKALQTSTEFRLKDDLADVDIVVTLESLLKPKILSQLEIDKINSTRLNKDTYKWDVIVPTGHIRFGVELVEYLIDKYGKYYAKNSANTWEPAHFKQLTNFTWIALDYQNGSFDPRRATIFGTETFFDLTIDAEWAKYNYNYRGKPLNGTLHLKGTIDLIVQLDEHTLELRDYKGLALDTQLPTPTGWTTMQDIQVGNILFDINGKQTKVIGKSKVKHLPCYKITFENKTSVICDNEHIWTLLDGSNKDVTQLTIGDKVSLCKPIRCKTSQLPIDPYVLGIWLGDGRNRSGEICGADKFVFSEIRRRNYKVGKDISHKDGICSSHTIFGLRTQLRLLNLLRNKHIPEIYLRASYEQRLDLLRGLMDSDGSVNLVRKQAVFTNCNKRLSDDVVELLMTLGQRPLQSNVIGFGFGKTVKVYPISFKPQNINPFLLPRKANKINNWGHGKSYYRKITNIEEIPSVPTQCIMVDSPTHTFLCTKDFIPTHNTGQRLDWNTGEPKTYKKLHDDNQLLTYYWAGKKLYPDKNLVISIFFIRDGGPYSICFHEEDILRAEQLFKNTITKTKNCELPILLDPTQKNFKCNRICDYYKQKVGNTNMCIFIHNEIQKHGLDYVVDKYTKEGFTVGTYDSPGEA